MQQKQMQHTGTIEDIARDWPKDAQEAAQAMIEKYGPPDEYSESQAIWYQNGPWKRTVVQREAVPHDWPAHHMDVLEQFIDYRVPPDKFDELAQFDGSVIVERTKGVISARCGGEAMNFVALNLANDIVIGKRSVEEARQEYVKLYKAYKNGQKPTYSQQFAFNVPKGGTADPDKTEIR
jgi:hypothetical protein